MKKINHVLSAGMLLIAAGSAQAVIIIDNNTGGLYNNGIGDLAAFYGPTQFPGANLSEGDPTLTGIAEPTFFTPAFGADWLNGDYTGGSWTTVANIPNSWAVNTEVAIVYEFTVSDWTDLHIDLGVDNGVYAWLNGNYLFGAMAPGGANINEYDIDIASLAAGTYSLQFLLEDHGGLTDFTLLVDAIAAAEPPVSVPEPGSLTLLALGLLGLVQVRRVVGNSR